MHMDDMIKFGKTPDSKLSFHGLALRTRTMNACTLYKSLSKGPLKKVVESSSGFLPWKDKFLDNFIQCYNKNMNQFHDSLILSLMQAYVSKMSDHWNPDMVSKSLTSGLVWWLQDTSKLLSTFLGT